MKADCGRNRMENIKDELGDIARETEVIRNMVVLLAEKRREAAMSTKPAAAVTVQQSPPAVAYNAAAAEDEIGGGYWIRVMHSICGGFPQGPPEFSAPFLMFGVSPPWGLILRKPRMGRWP